MGELRHHRGRLHRLSRSLAVDRRRARRLAAKLRRSHFLFLGYEMADWNLRLILNRLWGQRPIAYRSWAVQSRRAHSPALSGSDTTSPRSTSSPRRTSSCSSAGWRWHEGRNAGIAVQGAQRVRGLRARRAALFGRERENEVVAANLIASRLTVLYGPSSMGKSSLLRAAVRARSGRSPRIRSWSSSRAGVRIRRRRCPTPWGRPTRRANANGPCCEARECPGRSGTSTSSSTGGGVLPLSRRRSRAARSRRRFRQSWLLRSA